MNNPGLIPVVSIIVSWVIGFAAIENRIFDAVYSKKRIDHYLKIQSTLWVFGLVGFASSIAYAVEKGLVSGKLAFYYTPFNAIVPMVQTMQPWEQILVSVITGCLVLIVVAYLRFVLIRSVDRGPAVTARSPAA